jgi:hypothetical protein
LIFKRVLKVCLLIPQQATTTISSSADFCFIGDDVGLLPKLLAIKLDHRLAWSLEFKKVILAIEIMKKRTTNPDLDMRAPDIIQNREKK